MGPSNAVIVTTQPLETQAVLAHLHEVREETSLAGMRSYTGQFRGKQHNLGVVVAATGSGKTAALAMLVNRLITLYQPNFLFSVGMASGVQEVRPGDVVVATKVYPSETGPTVPHVEPRPGVWRASAAVFQRARAEGQQQTWLARLGEPRPDPVPRVLVGALAEGEHQLPFPPSQSLLPFPTWSTDVLALGWEDGSTLAAIRMVSSVPAVVIRGIADLREGNAHADGLALQHRAAHHAAALTFELLAALEQEAFSLPFASEPAILPEEQEDARWVQTRFQEMRGVPPHLPGWDAIVHQRGVVFAHQTDFSSVEAKPDRRRLGTQEDLVSTSRIWEESLARLQQELETKEDWRDVAWQNERTTIQSLEAFPESWGAWASRWGNREYHQPNAQKGLCYAD